MVENEDFDIISFVTQTLEPTNVPTFEGWYDEELNKTHITIHEYFDKDSEYQDDKASCINHDIQVDIWSKDSLEAFKLKKQVRKLMIENDFRKTDGQDFQEVKTKIYHKAMRFTYNEFI
ncbi:hypothetical protein GOD95_05135 [Paeniclostridium sordellii]|uniref:hypothetical protein n=1 Tax=Paraclostridium sordellii TaxID=1505 RepID=UPI0012ED397C|nr:hypothetical protein [Paeniclostridium sordellii]MVO70827.1 hypothetical protein [Paeniclostridium sordellii]